MIRYSGVVSVAQLAQLCLQTVDDLGQATKVSHLMKFHKYDS